jgi:hypothetical protein
MVSVSGILFISRVTRSAIFPVLLLQPEHVNAYAQAVIQTLRADPDERGCLSEESVLKGELKYQSSMQRALATSCKPTTSGFDRYSPSL